MEILKHFGQEEEQRCLLPEKYAWEEFAQLAGVLSMFPNVRIAYLDGRVELMVVGAKRERIKNRLESLLQVYFETRKVACGFLLSAEQTSEEKEVSFQPDLFCQTNESAERACLAIEIVFANSELDLLQRYERFEIAEVWLWQQNVLKLQANAPMKIEIYRFENGKYERCDRSQFCPDLDLFSFVDWVEMECFSEAKAAFLESLQSKS